MAGGNSQPSLWWSGKACSRTLTLLWNFTLSVDLYYSSWASFTSCSRALICSTHTCENSLPSQVFPKDHPNRFQGPGGSSSNAPNSYGDHLSPALSLGCSGSGLNPVIIINPCDPSFQGGQAEQQQKQVLRDSRCSGGSRCQGAAGTQEVAGVRGWQLLSGQQVLRDSRPGSRPAPACVLGHLTQSHGVPFPLLLVVVVSVR